MKTLTKPQPLPTWETDLEIERTTYAKPRRDIHPGLIVAIVDAFIAGVFFLLNPDLAEVGGWVIIGSALTCILFVTITNFKHIKEEF